MIADQNAKLSIFATRPAIYSPLYNFITETMGTVALILLALLIELQVGFEIGGKLRDGGFVCFSGACKVHGCTCCYANLLAWLLEVWVSKHGRQKVRSVDMQRLH